MLWCFRHGKVLPVQKLLMNEEQRQMVLGLSKPINLGRECTCKLLY